MNRRKFMLAVLGAAAATGGVVYAVKRIEAGDEDNGISLVSMAHPGSSQVTLPADWDYDTGWTCINGHEFCNMCPGPALSEASLEQMCIEIQEEVIDRGLAMSIKPTKMIWVG